jgi:hypothetical protein
MAAVAHARIAPSVSVLGLTDLPFATGQSRTQKASATSATSTPIPAPTRTHTPVRRNTLTGLPASAPMAVYASSISPSSIEQLAQWAGMRCQSAPVPGLSRQAYSSAIGLPILALVGPNLFNAVPAEMTLKQFTASNPQDQVMGASNFRLIDIEKLKNAQGVTYVAAGWSEDPGG